jgi:hypothetical protein
VFVEGTAHFSTRVTTDATGEAHVQVHVNYSNMHGEGLITGDRFVAASSSNEHDNGSVFDGSGGVLTLTQNVQFVGQGPNNNFKVRGRLHITVNANGDTTVSRQDLAIDCT